MAASVKAYTGVKATAPTDTTTLAPVYRNGRVRVCEDYVTTVNEAQVGSTIKLGWFPKGSWILGGTIAGGTLAANVTCTVGVVGVSGTSYDNDADAFNAATALTNTNITMGDNTARVAQTIPYQVTDPKGAYVLVTTANANTAASNQTITASINWVQD